MSSHEVKQMAPASLREIEGNPSSKEMDDIQLARMGKRPVLKVTNSHPDMSTIQADLCSETLD